MSSITAKYITKQVKTSKLDPLQVEI